METIELLKTLTSTYGVSGSEEAAAAVAMDLLKPYVDEVRIDNRGSVIGTANGTGPKILLDAHLDQCGYIVTSINDRGFLKFSRCGGMDERVASGLPVTVLGKKPIFGIISSIPPHLAKEEDEGKVKKEEDLCIDTGLTKEECESLITLGDRIVPNYKFEKLLGNQICSGAFDDRSCVAIVLKALETLKACGVKPNLSVHFTVQEEVNGQAAKNDAFASGADEAIILDVSFAKTPGCKDEGTGIMGKGPMIGIAPVLDNEIFAKLKDLATKNNIPYQVEVMNGDTGTHADEVIMTKSGIKTGMISLPLKFMHTPVEVIDTEDFDNCVKLLCEFIKSEGGNK